MGSVKRHLSMVMIVTMLLSSYGGEFVEVYAGQTGTATSATETETEVDTETETVTEAQSDTETDTETETETENTSDSNTETQTGTVNENITEAESETETETETEASTESATETSYSEEDTEDEDTEDSGSFLGSLLRSSLASTGKTTVTTSDLNTTLTGSVAYSGDENWSVVTRPENFDVSKFALYAYVNQNGMSVGYPLEIQDTDISGEVYLQFYNDNGAGTFTIKKVPKTLTVGSTAYSVESYVLSVTDMDYYVDTEASATPASSQTTDETLALGTLTLASDTISYTIKNTVKGGLTASATANYEVTISDGSATSATFKCSGVIPANTSGDSVGTLDVDVPNGLDIDVSMESSSFTAAFYYINDNGVDITSIQFTQSLGWNFRYVDNITSGRTATTTFDIYYKLNDGSDWVLLSDDASEEGYYENLLLTSMPTATCSNPKATNSYNYTLSGLPTYALGADGDYVAVEYKAEAVINSTNTYLTELISGDFMEGTACLVAQLAVDFTATINWYDASMTELRPSIDEVKNTLHLYSFCNGVYKDVTDEAGIVVTENASDSKVWDITVSNLLPRYDSDSYGITYFILQGTAEVSGDNAGTLTATEIAVASSNADGISYKTTYDNGTGTFGNSFDRAYSGGKIVNALYGEVDFSTSVTWEDKEDSVRPSATVTLMRYVKENSTDTKVTAAHAANAAIVAINDSTTGNQTILSYTLKTSGKTYKPGETDSDTVTTANSEVIDFAANCTADGNLALPRFDGYGNEYCYFALESIEKDEDATAYTVKYLDSEGNEDAKGAAESPAGIINRMESRVAVKVNTTWYAKSALSDLANITLTYKLVVKDGEDNFYLLSMLEGSDSMTGFGDVYTLSTVFTCDLSDGNGGYYVPYGVMEYVSDQGNTIAVTYENLSGNDETIATEGSFTIGTNTYAITESMETDVATSEDYDDIPLYTFNVKNIVSDNEDYSVSKLWGTGFELNEDKSAYVNDNASDFSALDFVVTGTPEKGTEINNYYVHFDVDENKRPTVATFRNSAGTVIDEVAINVTYKATSSGTTYCEMWTADFESVLPTYNRNGYKYVYTIKETTSGAWNYTHIYYSDNKAYVQNHIYSGPSDYVEVYFGKDWKDDGNTDNRADVELHAYVMDDDRNYIDLASTSTVMPECIENWLTANYTTEQVESYKTQWENGKSSFKTTLTASGNWSNYMVLPKFIFDYVSSNSTKAGVFEYSVGGNVVTYDSNDYTKEGTVQNGKYTYKVENPEETSKSATNTVVNTRYATVNLNLTENWYDGANANSTRPEYVDLCMIRNKNEEDEARFYVRKLVVKGKIRVKVFESSMTEITDEKSLEVNG
ncbi:MAG: hypothetical protein K6F37_05080, partial [Lachnospiraceae bacterium]|nr:hypothetical protein [Lachnospiraceae bacterium]